jgi:nitrogen fixation protein NifQ
MNAVALDMDNRESLYAWLMDAGRGEPVEDALARIIASWSYGYGAMPDYLGLSEAAFDTLMTYHFPRYPRSHIHHPGRRIDPRRLDEMEDLHKLLLQGRSGRCESEIWLADIVIAGCLGEDHLWQDLGLWNRADLSKLMHDNFAPLAARNDKDMKWKKFLYKQLCETEGIYTCRAPSCEVCTDYQNCFGPET